MSTTALLYLAVLLLAAIIVLQIVGLLRRPLPPAATDLAPLREQLQLDSRAGRMELSTQLSTHRGELHQLLDSLRASSDAQLRSVRTTLEQKVAELQASNEAKLEQMRVTVDEKLQSTLETRIGQSFELVSARLAEVQKGLGDMQQLANGVGDLKQVLSGVKTRGTFGELQLEAILEQVLTPDQYVKNWAPSIESGERVEFAIRLPGASGPAGGGEPTYIPIDAKFPQEEYQRLLLAIDSADADGVKAARLALRKQVLGYAEYIRAKYVCPPLTTDFGIIFLPTEGLFAEVLREPGLIEQLHSAGATLTGPTTLTAVLSALRMGFRTLAIEQRSAEVWQVLGAVRSEFGKFSSVLDKMKKQLGTLGATLEKTETRTRVMSRRLEQVQTMPGDQAAIVLALPQLEGEDEAEEPGDVE